MPSLPSLTPAETRRYGRHLVLPEVGPEGQRRLKASSALVVGAGGLGAPVALYLAAAGVGRIGLVDFDRVEESNLQRQVLYGSADIGVPKVEAASRRLHDLNPEIEVELHPDRLVAANVLDVLRGYEVVVDGTDNFPTRYLVNDAAGLLGLPYVYGSIFRFEGQASVFWKGRGPCYRCLHPSPPPAGEVPSCAEGGVLGVLPGIVGSIQAAEALKILLGRGETLLGRLLLVDALTMRIREMRLGRDPDCPLCGDRPTISVPTDMEEVCAVPAGEPAAEGMITPAELSARVSAGTAPVLIDVRMPQEWAICRLPGATLIPLPTLPTRLAELDPDAETVVYCHVGLRSAMARDFLVRHGFADVRNLAGGIDLWAREVDSEMARY